VINRRAALKGLALASGAALWTACALDQTATASGSYPTRRPPLPTATPYPTLTATPDLSPVLAQAREWFAVERVLRSLPLRPGGPADQALIAQAGGREQAIALNIAGSWQVNVPRVAEGTDSAHPADELLAARRELAAWGYGYDVVVSGIGAGKKGLAAVRDRGGVLRTNCTGDVFESPPTGGQAEVRWLGNAWVGGIRDGLSWGPPVPTRFDGTEKSFSGNFLLTCDDCHDEEDTRSIMAVAQAIGAKMTFFPNTPYVDQFPTLFQDILAAGHEVGYHTTTHSEGDWSPAYLESDCSYFETTVRAVTGLSDYRVVTARPPFGLWYRGNWQDWVESKGLVTAMWSRTIGWDSSPKVIRRTITENGGLILLAHANPLNVQWFKDNDALIKELAPQYRWPTVTEALLTNWSPVKVIGLPVEWTAT
jgi:Polysaccharide deacetylase